MGNCAFCGFTGKLTQEHVLGDWLSTIGLDLRPTPHVTGPLNRIGRDLGVRPPFRQTVGICGPCNNGWMSRLEIVAKRTLTPFILGNAGHLTAEDAGPVAAWLQKTALTAMLVSSEKERDAGYGLPPSEYHRLWTLRNQKMPLPTSQCWIGRYAGQRRLAATWVTPITVAVDGLPEPDAPQGYTTTIVLGQLLLHAVQFTTEALACTATTRQQLPQLWPATTRVVWPQGTPVDDTAFLAFAGAKDLRSTEPFIRLGPWIPATELPASQAVGDMVELPTICGKHVVFYPMTLVREAMRGRFYAFATACECRTAYLIHTEPDGAHCKAADTVEAVSELYEALPGQEIMIGGEPGEFICKRL
ncbi:hypothetical protein [Actinoplanes auranticolor]|uniref:Uncharacterized protein n=1 Tax=Actinoplanes auranticolor TaxID=47988 RepID=A0A919SWU2_9ACTN|nr:hypothetical protein [Actinoplanes auranticolor]GIM80131.1 hypothetical protein Aau02nite_89120 [Actinoplanes auranticolor]